MLRFGEIARVQYQSKHTRVVRACELQVEDIPDNFEAVAVTVTLPSETTERQEVSEIHDCCIVTVPANRNGSDPTEGIEDFNEITTLPGSYVKRLSELIGRPLAREDIGAKFTVKMPVLNLGKLQCFAVSVC